MKNKPLKINALDDKNRRHTDAFIAECKAALKSIQSEYANLLKKKELIINEMGRLESKILPYTQILEQEGIIQPTAALGRTGKNADLAFLVLKAAHKPMHIRLIWEKLSSDGVKTKSSDPGNMLASILSKDDRFRKVEPRTFGLADWVQDSGGLFPSEPT